MTVIEHVRQIAAAEDPDVAQALLENSTSEGIEVPLGTVRKVEGLSGQEVQILAEDRHGQQTIRAKRSRCLPPWLTPNEAVCLNPSK